VLVWRVDEPEIEDPRVPIPQPAPHIPATIPSNSEWPKIEKTVASPDLNLPAGYYFQEGPYTSRFWIEGKPPTVDSSPAKATTDPAQSADRRTAETTTAVSESKQLEDMLK